MITDDFEVKIIDMGLLDSQPLSKFIAGTEAYLSPEVLNPQYQRYQAM